MRIPVAYLQVAIGAALGSLCRYGLQQAWDPKGSAGLPLGTLVINVVGCLVIGAVIPLLHRSPAGRAAQPFATTGFLGGFTTFSAFAMETTALLDAGKGALAMGYVALTLLLGLMAVAIGVRLTARWGRP